LTASQEAWRCDIGYVRNEAADSNHDETSDLEQGMRKLSAIVGVTSVLGLGLTGFGVAGLIVTAVLMGRRFDRHAR